MRISDWSSDVCSSDLRPCRRDAQPRARGPGVPALGRLRAKEGRGDRPAPAPGAEDHASLAAVRASRLPRLRAFLGGQRVSRAQRPGADRLVAAAACAVRSRMRTVTATRYVTPLREGGSLPAVIEADDDGMYVMKFRGAGQGAKALVAEVVAGELARLLGLPIPEIVLVDPDPALARPDHHPVHPPLIRSHRRANHT